MLLWGHGSREEYNTCSKKTWVRVPALALTRLLSSANKLVSLSLSFLTSETGWIRRVRRVEWVIYVCVNWEVLHWNGSSMRAVPQLYSSLPSPEFWIVPGRPQGCVSVTLATKLWHNKNYKLEMAHHHQCLFVTGLWGSCRCRRGLADPNGLALPLYFGWDSSAPWVSHTPLGMKG